MLHTFQMILKRKGRRTEAAQGRRTSLALFLVLFLILPSCNHHDSGHRKYYSAYDNVINVKQDIREVPIEDVDISAWGKPYLLNDYLLLSDVMSYDKLIHIFDKNTFKYLTSVGNKGQGPGDKVVASYLGRAQFYEQDGQTQAYRPDKLLVFDLEGDHLSTLDVGYAILSFCYDAENNRLLFTFDDEIQFGYLDLGNIL